MPAFVTNGIKSSRGNLARGKGAGPRSLGVCEGGTSIRSPTTAARAVPEGQARASFLGFGVSPTHLLTHLHRIPNWGRSSKRISGRCGALGPG